MWEDFRTEHVDIVETRIFVRRHGTGPPVLMLHGFPQTHLMWREVAPRLARTFTVVCADLPGYGDSGCPPSAADHAPYSKRSMARVLMTVMTRLGFNRFSVVGHDRGGRVAARMALDHADRIDRIAVLDVAPSEDVWERADARFALAFWPWSFLAQAGELPERVLASAADTIVEHALGSWGSPSGTFPPDVREAYVRALRDPAHARAICEEYRAAAGIDRQHDRESRVTGRRITAPLLALWSASGAVGTWYQGERGPLGLWESWAIEVTGHPVEGGHFFPEETPLETAEALAGFLARGKPER